MKTLSFLNRVKEIIGYERYKYRVDHYPQKVIDIIWQRDFGYKIDWNNPKDLNEKIQWLICFGDTSKWPDLADKHKVREYVTKKGLAHLLPKEYGAWEKADEIDFDSLPEKFVLKCNHDSGSTYILDKAAGFDKASIISDLNDHLAQKYGYRYCEPHYNLIHPLVIAQEKIEMEDSPLSTLLVDYRIWCFHGKPFSIWIDYYPDDYNKTHHKNIELYDLDWNYQPNNAVFSERYRDGRGRISRPALLDDMLDAAAILSQGLPEARVDFYIANDRLYFGEITLTSNRGRITHYTPEYLVELGNQIHLPL